ncbi:LOW QUALITY PROTEIN: hypothetical protein ACHAW5_010342 [Stephanodiscus triporus]|uniref:Uncharacterized protein n=1 Tax=Stephanodiscus triporus TaxID=2934178 RepID=A0ABD3NQX3_9STRA
MVYLSLLTSILGAAISASKCTAFHSPSQHSLMKAGCRPIICTKKNNQGVALAENREGNIDIDSFLSSLPSLDDVKKNILEILTCGENKRRISSLTRTYLANVTVSKGKAGERGEQYVIAQFSLFLFITIGGLPIVGDALFSVLGPTLICRGYFWCTDPPSISTITCLRGPCRLNPEGLTSLKVAFILTFAIPCILAPYWGGWIRLDHRLCHEIVSNGPASDYEETKLIEKFGSDYEEYKMRVQGKFCPPNIISIVKSNSRT